MEIETIKKPWLPLIEYEAIVYDTLNDDIVKIIYTKNNILNHSHITYSEGTSEPILMRKNKLGGYTINENYNLVNIIPATKEEKDKLTDNLFTLRVGEFTMFQIFEAIPNEEFKTINTWVDEFVKYPNYFIYFNYENNINNYTHYNCSVFTCPQNDVRSLCTQMQLDPKLNQFNKIESLQKVSYNVANLSLFNLNPNNVEYRYFTMFKRYLQFIGKLPPELCTKVIVNQTEYEKFVRYKQQQEQQQQIIN